MAYVLAPEKRLAVLRLLVEGNSIRSTERLTEVHRDTIMRLLVKVGNECRDFLDREMRGLQLEHVQVDEIWTYCGMKQARVPVDERRDNPNVGDQYLFVAFDEATKLIPTFAVGKRTGDNARRFLVDLAARLVWPMPHDSDAHAFALGRRQVVTRLSSDAWGGYPEAVDLAFGGNVKYGRLNQRLPQYRPARSLCAA